MGQIEKLSAISGEALRPGTVEAEAENPLAQRHFDLLGRRNGFVAFESALLVRPVGGPQDVLASGEQKRSDHGPWLRYDLGWNRLHFEYAGDGLAMITAMDKAGWRADRD